MTGDLIYQQDEICIPYIYSLALRKEEYVVLCPIFFLESIDSIMTSLEWQMDCRIVVLAYLVFFYIIFLFDWYSIPN